MHAWTFAPLLVLAATAALAYSSSPAYADVEMPAESPASAEAPGPPPADAGEVLSGSKAAGVEGLRMPGIAIGGGALVLDKRGGSTQTFTQGVVRSEFALWRLQIGLDLRLNLDDDLNLRKEDWDEPSDWPRFIDFVQWGEPGAMLYGRLGRLYHATLGHGTLLAHYQSGLDLDRRKTGLEVEVNLSRGGIEAITNDVMSFEVIGARAYLDPLTGLPIPFVRQLRLSVQGVWDRGAPDELRFDEQGLARLDRRDLFRHDREGMVGFGGGLELPIAIGPARLTPYADLNSLDGDGVGLHAGARARFDLPFFSDVGLIAQAEYRVMDARYLPVYFDAQYEIDRYRYPDRSSPQTKQRFLEGVEGQTGYSLRAGVALPFIEASLGFESFTETPEFNRLQIGAEITGLPFVRARAVYTHRGSRSLQDAFRFDEQTTLLVQALVDVWQYCIIDISVERAFRVDTSGQRYKAVDAWNPALLIGWYF